ncbi:MAG: hypothetical protein QOC72_1445 [Methylobacteriaceae bacterium]|jgi:hypothetical protein|nr:hypothetical protein [Methylobacteriaceae bacterium]
MARPWHHPFKTALRLGAYLLSHACVALLAVGIIYVVRKVTFGAGDPLLFGKVPVSYVFDGLDAFVLLVLCVALVIEAWWVLREVRNEE